MTRSAERPVVHEIVGGFCRVCGDTAEYLVDRGRDVVEFVDPEEALTLKAKLGANVTLVPLQGGHIVETYDEVNHDMIVDFIETHAA